jgi:hypothetical protein
MIGRGLAAVVLPASAARSRCLPFVRPCACFSPAYLLLLLLLPSFSCRQCDPRGADPQAAGHTSAVRVADLWPGRARGAHRSQGRCLAPPGVLPPALQVRDWCFLLLLLRRCRLPRVRALTAEDFLQGAVSTTVCYWALTTAQLCAPHHFLLTLLLLIVCPAGSLRSGATLRPRARQRRCPPPPAR